MIRVISSFADGPVNFHSTGPAEDQIQKLISSTETASKVLLWESQHGQQTLTSPKLTLDWTIPKKKDAMLDQVVCKDFIRMARDDSPPK